MRQTMYYIAFDMLKKARKLKSGGDKNILERWHDDDKYRNSLTGIGWTEEQIIQYDAIALEDQSHVATRQERSRNGKSWKFSLNADGIQGPLNQRSDFVEAKRECEMETNRSLLHNKSGNGLINNLKASKNTITDLNFVQDGDSILWKSNRSWDSWQTSSWTEQ